MKTRRPQTTQDGNHIALRCGTEIEGTRRPLKVEVTSADKTTRDKRVPEGHSAVYCSSPPGREDSSVFLTDTKLSIAFLQFLHFSDLNTHTHTLLSGTIAGSMFSGTVAGSTYTLAHTLSRCSCSSRHTADSLRLLHRRHLSEHCLLADHYRLEHFHTAAHIHTFASLSVRSLAVALPSSSCSTE